MPQTVTALTGSCVQIPCTFSISNFEDKRKRTKSIYGIWLKNISQYASKDSFIAFNSSEYIIKGFSDIQMTGNLNERNCTTVFYNIMKNHSDLYYFRLQMEPNVFRATFNPRSNVSSKTVRINVTDSAQPPELNPSELQYVKEGTTVNLSCSAEAPCPKQPPTISWSNIPESAHITTQLQEKPDKTQSVFSYVTFKASYKDHRKNITCTATYPRNTPDASTVKSTVMLRVLLHPTETHINISPSTSVSFGTNGTSTALNKSSSHSTAEIQLTAEITGISHDTGQDGYSMSVIAGSVGGIVALITLFAIGFCARTRMKTRRGEKVSVNQAHDETIDRNSTYATVLTVTNQEKISEDQYVPDCNTEFSSQIKGSIEEDNNEKCSDVVYAQVHVLIKKPKAISVLPGDIYAQVKK
ncbi:sialic acid-binding Ig-like lectin 14 [Onychostoma macrolepis]|uniref:sialic acid-binding Ig-like lectin 14 n=1 Tax=Onychostoma macrolepis TaxID=369639 RepID=UPI00272D1848|nr:sialic acid-binding Ig-like lectin 14 [Onychostoma macrolepis]